MRPPLVSVATLLPGLSTAWSFCRPPLFHPSWSRNRLCIASSPGGRASAAHLASASDARAIVLDITNDHISTAAEIQDWLGGIYDAVDYASAIISAGDHPQPFEEIADDEGTTYGEFPLHFLVALLERLAPADGARFFDLGSGRGQVVLAAAKLRPWVACSGVEILPELHFIALDAGRIARDSSSCAPSVSFELRDLYAEGGIAGNGSCAEVSSNDVVFVYATCLEVDDSGSLAKLTSILEGLPVGTSVVTVNRPLVEGDGRFGLVAAYRGPNPEAEDEGSTAYVWRKL